MTNEQKGLDAIVSPIELTLGQLARLERMGSPLLAADFSSLTENIKGLYAVFGCNANTFVDNADSLDALALAWADKLSQEEYEAKMKSLCDGLVRFGVLMPRPDEDAKKKCGSETDGSLSSQSGAVEHTATS